MDIQHFFIEKGQGEPIILLHGNGENSDYFVNQIGVLSKLYHVYALDTRGHGRTPRGERPFTIRQFADDLLGFMVNDPNISTSELSAIKAETLVIAGTKDMMKEVHTRQIASHISNCDLKFIKGNHFIANKNPDDFNEAVLNFLRD